VSALRARSRRRTRCSAGVEPSPRVCRAGRCRRGHASADGRFRPHARDRGHRDSSSVAVSPRCRPRRRPRGGRRPRATARVIRSSRRWPRSVPRRVRSGCAARSAGAARGRAGRAGRFAASSRISRCSGSRESPVSRLELDPRMREVGDILTCVMVTGFSRGSRTSRRSRSASVRWTARRRGSPAGSLAAWPLLTRCARPRRGRSTRSGRPHDVVVTSPRRCRTRCRHAPRSRRP